MTINESPDMIYGRWPVREALEAGPVAQIFLARGVGGGPIDEILKLAQKKQVAYHWVDRKKLDQMVGDDSHQGVVAQVAPLEFAALDEIFDIAKNSNLRGPSVLFLDGIMDP